MVYEMYVMYDKVAKEVAGQITFAKNEEVALRGYRKGMEKVTTPEDFKLVCLGSLDTESLEMVTIEPHDVAKALSEEEFMEKVGTDGK